MMRSWVLAIAACASTPPAETTPLRDVKTPRTLELAVDVIRWRCRVAYDGFDSDELRVPLGRTIRLALHSRDLDHDVSISTGAKATVKARETTTLELRFDHVDAYTWTCPMDVGPNPPEWTTKAVIVMTQPELDAWIRAQREAQHPTTREGKLALGHKIYEKKGCVACHTVDGTQRIGPSWKGIWGTTVTLSDGTTRVVDAAYVRESIEHPQAFARPGYPPAMPSFEGQLRQEELAALVGYIEALADPAGR